MQSETGFPSSHQLKSYVAYKSRLKLAARAVLSADAGLLVQLTKQPLVEVAPTNLAQITRSTAENTLRRNFHPSLNKEHFYLRQGGYVFVVVCLSVCLSVMKQLRKNFQTDLHESFRECWQWVNEQLIKFWWRSGSPSGYRDCFSDSSVTIGRYGKWYKLTAPLCDAAEQGMRYQASP